MRRAPVVMSRLGLDRARLRSVDGLLFWRLLGTGRRDDTGPSADLGRSALFAVWRDEAALEAFMSSHAIAARWKTAAESWHVRLRGLGGHGAWHGVSVLDGLEQGSDAGPVAILTRADVRLRSWPAFRRSSRIVADEVRRADGLLAVVGIGEAPLGRLGTFSLWRSLADVASFATDMPAHGEVIRRTRTDNWYREELFARFEPFASSGSWGGCDPLANPTRHDG